MFRADGEMRQISQDIIRDLSRMVSGHFYGNGANKPFKNSPAPEILNAKLGLANDP